MNELIHLLIALTLLGVGVCLFFAILIIHDMKVVAEYLVDTYDRLEAKEKKMESDEKRIENEVKEAILAGIRQRFTPKPSINVVGKDKPLDFPNDHV